MELNQLVKNISISKEIIEQRKILPKKEQSEVSFDIDVETFQKIKELSQYEEVSFEEYMQEFIHQLVLQSFKKPEGVEKVIDEVIFHVHCDEIMESGLNYLLVDSQNLDKRAILVTEPSMVETISNQNKK